MGNFLFACFSGIKEDEAVEVGKPKLPECVHRDELNEKKPSETNHAKNGLLNRELLHCFPRNEEGGRDDAERSSSNGSGGRGGLTRVKIVLTKQEAALMVSKCKGKERVLEDIVSQLEKFETSRISVVSPSSFHDSWKPALECIPEEFQM